MAALASAGVGGRKVAGAVQFIRVLRTPMRPLRCMVLVAVLSAGGCASRAPAGPGDLPASTADSATTLPAAAHAAQVARAMVGTPYRYGGATPNGFDCSGLVYFSYARAGLRVPRTSAALRRAARPVARHAMRRGDLLFFDGLSKTGHVGLYLGDDRFVHAPSSGKRVQTARLDQGFFASRLSQVGRLTP